jgi:hypothetical protein
MRLTAAGVVLVATCLATPVGAADTSQSVEPGPWKLGSVTTLNLSQSSFSGNWSGGDKGSVVWVLGADSKAERQFSRRFHLDNQLLLAYGQTLQQQPETAGSAKLVWATPRKTTDLIQFESTARFTLGGWVDPYASLRLDSQFRDESDPAGAISFNPVKLTETAGVARVFLKSEDRELISRLGVGLRETSARAIVDPVTLRKESFRTTDGGIEWQTQATQPMLEKKVLYKGKLLVFLPVYYNKQDDLKTFDLEARAADPARAPVKDYWRAPDVNLQNQFTTQITKLLAVSLVVHFVYDKYDQATNATTTLPIADRIALVDRGVRKAGQFRETLALSFTYALF